MILIWILIFFKKTTKNGKTFVILLEIWILVTWWYQGIIVICRCNGIMVIFSSSYFIEIQAKTFINEII